MNDDKKGAVERIAFTLDTLKVTRRIGFYFTLAITYIALDWAIDFASVSTKSGTDISLIIAAIMTPVAGLQGFMAKFYHDGGK